VADELEPQPQAEIVEQDPNLAMLEALGEVTRGFIEPITEAEKVKAVEATKRHAAEVGLRRVNMWVTAGLSALVVIGLFVFAFLHPETGEKLLIAAAGLAAGYIAGRGSAKGRGE